MSTPPPNTPKPPRRSHLLARRTIVLVGICVCLFAVFNHFWLGSFNPRGHYPTHDWPVSEILLTLMAEGLLLVLLIGFCEKWYRGRSVAQFRLGGLLCFRRDHRSGLRRMAGGKGEAGPHRQGSDFGNCAAEDGNGQEGR